MDKVPINEELPNAADDIDRAIFRFFELAKGDEPIENAETVFKMGILYLYTHMKRDRHEDAPTHGPEVDEHESQEKKHLRAKAVSAVNTLKSRNLI